VDLVGELRNRNKGNIAHCYTGTFIS